MKQLIKSIPPKIYNIKNTKVMLDSDLAELYGVETKQVFEAIASEHII